MEGQRVYSWEHPRYISASNATPPHCGYKSPSSCGVNCYRRASLHAANEDSSRFQQCERYPPLFCSHSTRASPSTSRCQSPCSRGCSNTELRSAACNSCPSCCCTSSRSCVSQKPYRIIIPAKTTSIFDDLRRSRFFNLLGNLLTLAVIVLFIMSMIEHVLYHEVGSHGGEEPEESEEFEE